MAIKIAGTEVINDNRELVLAKLTEVNASIENTAVDVFVYDTSQDTDGGAWRHRTQHTSWYNEGASSTRGSRKEFPAVAVIVAEASKVTIYDGDDPSLPMWMVFDAPITTNTYFLTYGNSGGLSAVSARNGTLTVGRSSTTTANQSYNGITIVSFIADAAERIGQYSGTNEGAFSGGISTRNAATLGAATGKLLVENHVNDVAMTVLPDAPTDAATGLPVPTIAVATDGGVSVIRDDGTVVDITQSGYVSNSVAFTEDNRILVQHTVGAAEAYYRVPLPTSDVTTNFAADGFAIQEGNWSVSHQIDTITSSANIVANGNGMFLGEGGGLHTFNEYAVPKSGGGEDDANALHAITTSSYNTGWLSGDIKLAALADTTAETFGDAASGATVSDPNGDGVYDGEHVTNGDAWLGAAGNTPPSGWTTTSTVIQYSVSAGNLTLDRNNEGTGIDTSQTITTEVGKVYRLHLDIASISTGNLRVAITGTTASSYTQLDGLDIFFTATSTSTTIGIRNTSPSGVTVIRELSVRLADPDRSVNGNGLAVHGSITKAAVATGADLVAYSGFSSSNYLQQPYNSDLDFGTGDFCVMGWVKTANNSYDGIFHRSSVKQNTSGLRIASTNTMRLELRNDTTLVAYVDNFTSADTWTYVVATRSNGVAYLYVNGVQRASASFTDDVSDAGATTLLGQYYQSGAPAAPIPALALIRISATAPTADQIEKIYNDEKLLFQENAKATLYGSSNAVTALAYDNKTQLLHVGTSSGRSEFQGLRRINNTTTAVTTAISASDDLVVEQ